MKPEELSSYFVQMAKKAGLSDAEITQINQQVFSKPEVAKLWLDDFVPRPEFSSGLNRQKEEYERQLEQHKLKIREFDAFVRGEAIPENERLRAELKRQREELDKARSGFTEESTAQNRSAAPDLSQYASQFQEQSNQLFETVMGMNAAQARHFKEFGVPLDVDTFQQLAEKRWVERQSSGERASVKRVIQDTYDEFTRDSRRELQEKTEAERLAKARAEAVEEYKRKMSQMDLPVDSAPRDSGMRPVIDPDIKPTPMSEADRMRGFVEAWNTTVP